MSRKRRPEVKPIAAAVEAVYWRGTQLCEELRATQITQALDSLKPFEHALADLAASRVQPNGHVSNQGVLQL